LTYSYTVSRHPVLLFRHESGVSQWSATGTIIISRLTFSPRADCLERELYAEWLPAAFDLAATNARLERL
jgi:hypothetical protein